MLDRNLNLELTRECNSKCITCNFWQQTDPENALCVHEWVHAIREYRNLEGAHYIKITGGEPLTKYDTCIQIVKESARLKLKTFMNTNGILLTERKTKEVVQSGLNDLCFSLNSHYAQVHNYTRGVSCFNHVIHMIKHALTIKNRTAKIRVNAILAEWNYKHFIAFIQYCQSIGVEAFDFNCLSPSFWCKDNFKLNARNELKKVVLEILQNRDRYPIVKTNDWRLRLMLDYCEKDVHTTYENRKCLSPIINYIIDTDGNIRICFTSHFSEVGNVKLGNIRHTSLVDLDKSKYLNVYRRKLHNKCNRWCMYVNCNEVTF